MLASGFLSFFDGAELEDATRILLRSDGPPARAVPQKALEITATDRRLIHFFDRAKLLYAAIRIHRSFAQSLRIILGHGQYRER